VVDTGRGIATVDVYKLEGGQKFGKVDMYEHVLRRG